jgi:Ca2+-binding EF-hand superfamily protein
MSRRAPWAAVLLLALAAGGGRAADPADAHDLFVFPRPGPPLRLRLWVEVGGPPAARREGQSLRLDPAPAGPPYAALLSRALAAALDRDGDGKLTRAELRAAERVLADFDADEDECVTPFELVPALLTDAPPGRARALPALVLLHPGQAGEDRLAALRAGAPAGAGRAEAAGWLRRGPDAEVHVRLGDPVRDRRVLHAGGWQIDVVTQPAPPAEGEKRRRTDRRDAEGLVTLTVAAGPRGWFEVLDADGDGQLGVAELRAAWDRLADAEARKAGFVRAPGGDDPVLTLTFAPGPAGARGTPLVRRPAPGRGPDWFRAMDRNGDGFLSPREFIGTREDFRRLDRDGDGLISPEEAALSTLRKEVRTR